MNEHVIATAEFDPKVRVYWLLSGILILTVTLVGIPLLLLWIPLGLLITQRYLDRMSCVLTDRSLKVSKGVLNRLEKTVPLDKITDMALRQGPIMRLFDLQGLSVETAGQSSPGSLVTLVGVRDAGQFRDTVLAQRDHVTSRVSEVAAAPETTVGALAAEAVLVEIRDSMLRIEALLAES